VNNSNFVYLIFINFLLWGYGIIGPLSSLIGLRESSYLSISLRLLIALLALKLFFKSFAPRCNSSLLLPVFSAPFVCFVIFWITYGLRLIWDCYFDVKILPMSSEEFIVYAFVFAFSPALAGFFKVDRNISRSILKTGLMFGTMALLVITLDYVRMMGGGSYAFAGRAGTEKINPISLGYLGGSLFLISCMAPEILVKYHGWRPRIFRLSYIVSGAIGFVGLIAAASKGPLIALAISFLILNLLPISIRRVIRTTCITSLIATVLYFVSNTITEAFGFDIFKRFSTMSGNHNVDTSTLQRYISFNGALDQFVSSPITGNALVEEITNNYPHNVLLESFMAVGIIGGTAFSALFILSVIGACRLVSERNGHELIGILTIQYLVASMFSGSLYTSSAMWFFMISSITLSCVPATRWSRNNTFTELSKPLGGPNFNKY
jgi:hypothetical protein